MEMKMQTTGSERRYKLLGGGLSELPHAFAKQGHFLRAHFTETARRSSGLFKAEELSVVPPRLP
jgi:hypothetical protein